MADGNESFVGSIDQGTTSSRFLIFNKAGEVVASHQLEFAQIYAQPGYVSNAFHPPVMLRTNKRIVQLA